MSIGTSVSYAQHDTNFSYISYIIEFLADQWFKNSETDMTSGKQTFGSEYGFGFGVLAVDVWMDSYLMGNGISDKILRSKI